MATSVVLGLTQSNGRAKPIDLFYFNELHNNPGHAGAALV
jgi:hypothetical protein